MDNGLEHQAKDKLILNGFYGTGVNHVRLILGLRTGHEIRDLSGRRLPDDKKVNFIMKTFYHDNRASVCLPPLRGGNTNVWESQSYWLRIEWLTRDSYKDSVIIQEKISPSSQPWIYFKINDPNRVLELYRAKCPDLNGLSVDQFLQEACRWKDVPGGTDFVIDVDQLYERDWIKHNVDDLLGQVGGVMEDRAGMEEIHHRWCDLNDRVVSNRAK